MKSAWHKTYTISNNLNATNNILSAIVETDKAIHCVHLGTMGVYGYGTLGTTIPEGYLNVKVPLEDGSYVDRQILHPANPGSARLVSPGDAEAVLGNGFRLAAITAEVVPNGFWPLDFGGALGEPVTRGIAAKLPWLSGGGDAPAAALRAAGLPGVEAIDAREAFTRK